MPRMKDATGLARQTCRFPLLVMAFCAGASSKAVVVAPHWNASRDTVASVLDQPTPGFVASRFLRDIRATWRWIHLPRSRDTIRWNCNIPNASAYAPSGGVATPWLCTDPARTTSNADAVRFVLADPVKPEVCPGKENPVRKALAPPACVVKKTPA